MAHYGIYMGAEAAYPWRSGMPVPAASQIAANSTAVSRFPSWNLRVGYLYQLRPHIGLGLSMGRGDYGSQTYHFSKSNEKISFVIKTLNENSFYNFLGVLGNEFNKEIRGIHKANEFSISGDLPWSIKDNNSFTINLLNKEISDFSLDIKKEIYKDKLIIICEIEGAFELLNLISDLNLIDRFQIELKEIQSLPEQIPLFQIIIH